MNKLIIELKALDEGVKTDEKRSSLNNIGIFLDAGEKVLNDFKIRIFSIKDKIPTPECEPTPEPVFETSKFDTPAFDTPKTKRKKSPLKLCEKVLNYIKNEEKYR